jgi:hypothetical protein
VSEERTTVSMKLRCQLAMAHNDSDLRIAAAPTKGNQ